MDAIDAAVAGRAPSARAEAALQRLRTTTLEAESAVALRREELPFNMPAAELGLLEERYASLGPQQRVDLKESLSTCKARNPHGASVTALKPLMLSELAAAAAEYGGVVAVALNRCLTVSENMLPQKPWARPASGESGESRQPSGRESGLGSRDRRPNSRGSSRGRKHEIMLPNATAGRQQQAAIDPRPGSPESRPSSRGSGTRRSASAAVLRATIPRGGGPADSSALDFLSPRLTASGLLDYDHDHDNANPRPLSAAVSVSSLRSAASRPSTRPRSPLLAGALTGMLSARTPPPGGPRPVDPAASAHEAAHSDWARQTAQMGALTGTAGANGRELLFACTATLSGSVTRDEWTEGELERILPLKSQDAVTASKQEALRLVEGRSNAEASRLGARAAMRDHLAMAQPSAYKRAIDTPPGAGGIAMAAVVGQT